MKKRKLSIIASIMAILFIANIANANLSVAADIRDEGVTIRGNVTEVTDQGETPLPFATVMIEGTSIGVTTDFDGNYQLTSPSAGRIYLTFAFMGFKTVTKEINCAPGEVAKVDIALSADDTLLDEVVVVGKVNKESENALILTQKKSAVAIESVGASELSRKGSSDVAAGVKKVAGISMMGSNQLFVRGLGDRYNSAILNGLPLTSPDPTKKVIRLDIFPSGIVKYLGVSKVYTANNFADYTGAQINIQTKEYPTSPFIQLSLGSRYNTKTTGKEFRRIEAEGARFFGFDLNKRAELTPDRYKTVNRLMDIEDDFNIASYGYETSNAAPDLQFGLSGGKLFEMENGSELGVIFNLGFDNKSQMTPGKTEYNLNRQGTKRSFFTSDVYEYGASTTGLLNLAYNINDNNQLKYNLVYLRDGKDSYKDKVGFVNDWDEADDNIVRVSEYVVYSLFNNQLSGTHKFMDNKLIMNWSGSYGVAKYDVPDRREVIYQRNGDEYSYLTLNNGSDTKRVVVDQFADEVDLNLKGTYKLNDGKGLFTMGAQAKVISQTYNSYLYGYFFDQDALDNVVVDIDNPNSSLNNSTVDYVKNNSSDDMGYQASQSIYAAFADLVLNVNDKVVINPGVRVEVSETEVTGHTLIDNEGDEDSYIIDYVDLFPALSVKYTMDDKRVFRASASRTVVRPSFYEKTPARLIPETGDYSSYGNPYSKDNPYSDGTYLENSYSYNVDVKFELFPEYGELISLAGYYKLIANPIESVTKLQGGTDYVYTYMNIDENAHVGGVELDIKKRFGNLYTGLNAAYIYTNIDIPLDRNENDKSRMIQGASPYLINGDLGYSFNHKDEVSTSYVGLTYNVFGKRISTVGIAGIGNQYELPKQSMDFVAKTKIKERLNFDLKITNLLNQSTELVQDVYDTDDNKTTQTVEKYNNGVSISLKAAYRF